MVYLPTFTIKVNQMLVNIPYMDPMGYLPSRPLEKHRSVIDFLGSTAMFGVSQIWRRCAADPMVHMQAHISESSWDANQMGEMKDLEAIIGYPNISPTTGSQSTLVTPPV